MTHKGTFVYQAPEVSRGERYGFAVDVYSFALTMYELCDRDVPYTLAQRRNGIKLAMDIAEKAIRPKIRESWNPAVSLLITSCWTQNADLRPSFTQIRESLSQIMLGTQGLVTASRNAKAGAGVTSGKQGNLCLAPGALWRRIETLSTNIIFGDVIGAGSYSTVRECIFQNRRAACKVFRNTSEESAFKEIEIVFALRHPNIIGLYAWFQIKGTLKQTGMVIEKADGGDLRRLYKQTMGQQYSFELGLKIVLGAAKGLAYMHSMPTPFVHRDVKSQNIMVMGDGVTGKLGDCGESRRIDLDSTMTRTGSPLWAAPELLAGKRYSEIVDSYSLGW